jgi:hypothetical protein
MSSTESAIRCVYLAVIASDQIQSQLGVGRTRMSRTSPPSLELIRHFPGPNNDFSTLARILEHGRKLPNRK